MIDSTQNQTAVTIAKLLLEAKAIKLSPEKPFQWSSGWNSPIYCDNRVTLSFPSIRTTIKEELSERIKKDFPGVEAIAGVATAGIAQGALIADYLNLPYAYVRPEPKKHGMGNQIEGRLEPGQKVVVVEDLISTGGSSLKVVEALRAYGVEVVGMVAIFTYGFSKADENFAAAGVQLSVLSNYNFLMEAAVEAGHITSEQVETLSQWRLTPETWGK